MLPDLQQRIAVDVASPPAGETLRWQPGPDPALFYRCWSLAINLFFGVLGLLLLLLLLPLLVVCIRLDSPGPIFYTQERLGLRGRRFAIYKFRSMRVDAEADGRPGWTARDDARVTRVGHVLRTTHLDELPQVFNILQGDMALIGPRPEREVFAANLERTEPLYRQRLRVKPGLTGWAQVRYGYGEHSGELQKLQYDLYYIQERSVRLDIVILLKTVLEVLTLRGR